MQDKRDAGQEVWMQENRNVGQEGSGKGGMQHRKDAGQEERKTGGMQYRKEIPVGKEKEGRMWDVGLEGCRTGGCRKRGMQDRMKAGQESG